MPRDAGDTSVHGWERGMTKGMKLEAKYHLMKEMFVWCGFARIQPAGFRSDGELQWDELGTYGSNARTFVSRRVRRAAIAT